MVFLDPSGARLIECKSCETTKALENLVTKRPASSPSEKTVHFLNVSILILIFLNVLAVIYETVDGLYAAYKAWFDGFEYFSIGVFTLEYIVRLTLCVKDKRFQRPVVGRLKYALTPLALVDLFSVLPFYLPLIFPFDLRFIRIVRLLRVFRILKIGHYSEKLSLIKKVIHAKRGELMVTLLMAFIILVLNSCLIYFAEHDAQPVAFPDIPSTIWWCFMTLSTMGYKDIVPITTFGKLVHVVDTFVGIGLFALPAGILGEGFVEEISKKRKR